MGTVTLQASTFFTPHFDDKPFMPILSDWIVGGSAKVWEKPTSLPPVIKYISHPLGEHLEEKEIIQLI